MPITPELEDVVATAHRSEREDIWTSLPGVVVSYDAAKQKADVQPAIGGSHVDQDNKRVAEALPVLKSVPVLFPGGGGFRVTFPLTEGDTGLIVFCAGAIDRWCAGSGDKVDPGDDRRHTLSDAVFIPGLKAFGAPWGSASSDNMSVGNDSGDAVIAITGSEIQAGGTQALAFLLELRALVTTVNALVAAFNIHVHTVEGVTVGPTNVPSDGPAGVGVPATAASIPAGTTVLKAG